MKKSYRPLTHGLAAVTAAGLNNALIFGMGWNNGSTIPLPPFAPPGYVIGLVWMGLFAAMGAAHGLVTLSKITTARQRLADARLIMLLLAYCFVHPYYSFVINNLTGSVLGTLGAVLLSGGVAARVYRSSRRASGLIALVTLWTLFASTIVLHMSLTNERGGKNFMHFFSAAECSRG